MDCAGADPKPFGTGVPTGLAPNAPDARLEPDLFPLPDTRGSAAPNGDGGAAATATATAAVTTAATGAAIPAVALGVVSAALAEATCTAVATAATVAPKATVATALGGDEHVLERDGGFVDGDAD